MKPISFLLLCLFAPALSPAGVWAEEMRIVAVVNNEVITQSELKRAVMPIYLQLQASMSPEEAALKVSELQQQILDQLIEEKLMLQEAKNPAPVEFSKNRIGTPPPITVSEQEIDQMVERIASTFESRQAFEEAMKTQGFTMEQMRQRYRDQITIRKLINRQIYARVSVSPSEVTAYYQSHMKEFIVPAAVQVAVLMIKPKPDLNAAQARSFAQSLRQQILQGGDFYDLAARYSDGPNPQMGGRIGFLDQGKSLKEIDSVLFNLKPGEISPVIETAAGFHIFRIEGFRPAEQAPLESVKDVIRDKLYNQKGGAMYQEWIRKLKENAYISIS
ncbi:MAG: peptidylprolyl isomerase [Candidatus Omnitrophica bacterium]|nr:peptidylprolyl isomerase [Candidatus Omnitrophota bacterium]